MPSKAVIDVEGSEAVSSVLLELLNQFPGLPDGKKITFSTLQETSGIGFFPTTGAALLSNVESITGKVKQVCLYPFDIVYRASPKSEMQRMRIKEFLDILGKWLERQPVIIQGATEKLETYPPLESGNRIIKAITRSTPAFLNAVYETGVEDWIISGQLTYNNEYYK